MKRLTFAAFALALCAGCEFVPSPKPATTQPEGELGAFPVKRVPVPSPEPVTTPPAATIPPATGTPPAPPAPVDPAKEAGEELKEAGEKVKDAGEKAGEARVAPPGGAG